jgi:hypothetical protein
MLLLSVSESFRAASQLLLVAACLQECAAGSLGNKVQFRKLANSSGSL